MHGTCVYVSNAESKDIFVFSMDCGSGALELIERVPVPGTDVPSPTSLPMAVSPDRRFLYAALRSAPYPVSSFAIDPASGRLAHLATAPLISPMAYIVTDRAGRFLLCASYVDAKVAVYAIDGTGWVEAPAKQVIATGPRAHCVVVDAANRFAYCAVLGADHVMQFIFDAEEGRLMPNAPAWVAVHEGAGPRHLAFHPSRRFLYLLNETDGTVGVYAIEEGTGRLGEVETVRTLPADFAGKASAADIHVTPDGRLLYASERRTSTLTGFRVEPGTGRLSLIARWPTETTPRGFAIDSRGRLLIAAGLDSNRVSVHAIDGEGGELEVRGRYEVGGKPNWVEVVDFG